MIAKEVIMAMEEMFHQIVCLWAWGESKRRRGISPDSQSCVGGERGGGCGNGGITWRLW